MVMGRQISGLFSAYKLEILLVVFVWLVIGLTINSRNLDAFNLQQMGVEAIVERGVFYVDGSKAPNLQPIGDVFDYQGHKYAAKQPGQFLIGAFFYFFLHLLGLNYVSDYLLTSALVTFFSASLIAGISTVAIYHTARLLSKDGASNFLPLIAAFLYVFGTTALPYAGIAHHDSIATSYLAIAFYFAVRYGRMKPGDGGGNLLSVLIGLFLGLVVTTSMLVFWPALAVGLYFVSVRRWGNIPFFLLGGTIGILPLLVYDAVNFGNPFLLPNVAGNYSDTFFHFTVSNFVDKAGFYLKATIGYAPIILIGLGALWLIPRALLREKLAVVLAVILLCGYIFNIDSVGTCEYGPRYLLPLMGLGCLGIVGFGYLESRYMQFLSIGAVLIIGLIGVVLNFVGAIGGAMYCDLGTHAFMPHWKMIMKGEQGTFPLFRWLLIPAIMMGFFLITNLWRQHHGESELASQPIQE